MGEAAVRAATPLEEVPRARAQLALANACGSAGDLDRAADLYASATETFRRLDLGWDLAIALLNTADNAFGRGDLAGVERAATESLELTRKTGDDAGTAVNLGNLAFAALEAGQLDRAEKLLGEALERSESLGFMEWLAIMLDGHAAIAAARRDDARASNLLGAAGRIREEIGASLDSIELRVHQRTMDDLRDRLGPDALEAAIEIGRSMPNATAIALATSSPPSRDARAG
jgi:non-specific serine/threonine protein kinase